MPDTPPPSHTPAADQALATAAAGLFHTPTETGPTDPGPTETAAISGDTIPASLPALRASLAALRAKHPAWRFGTVWASASPSPHQRRLWATKDEILLTAWTAAQISHGIHHEEHGSDTSRRE